MTITFNLAATGCHLALQATVADVFILVCIESTGVRGYLMWMQRDAEELQLQLMLQFHSFNQSYLPHSPNSQLNSCPLCRAFMPQAVGIVRFDGDLLNLLWKVQHDREAASMIASFDLYRLCGTIGLDPCRVLHRFVTGSGFILHCAFHIS